MIVSITDNSIHYGVAIEGATQIKITTEQYSLINKGIAEIVDGELVINEELLNKKERENQEREKQKTIVSEYPLERQIAIITNAIGELSTDRDLQDMITFISSLNEDATK